MPFVALQSTSTTRTATIKRRTSFQLPNLHSSRTSEDVGSLSHQPGRIDFCTCSNDLTLTNPLLLSCRAQGSGHFGTEDDILDENAFDGDTPLVSDFGDDFGDFKGDGFTVGYNGLDSTSSNDVSESGLGSFHQSGAKISDAECCTVRVDDMVVNNRVAADGWGEKFNQSIKRSLHVDIDIISRTVQLVRQTVRGVIGDSHNGLSANRTDLDLDIDNAEGFSADVDLDKAWIDRLVELAETRDQTHRTYVNISIINKTRVGRERL